MIPKGKLEIAGEIEIYDDGLFRIELPSELTVAPSSDAESMIFTVGDLPLQIEWTTIILDKDQIEQLGSSTESIDVVMRYFMLDLPEDAPLKLIQMANGFNMASSYGIHDGECRSYYLLGLLNDEDVFIGTSLELKGVDEWDGDPRFAGLSHLLKNAIRFAHCSIGEPRINSSRGWLSVDRIGVRFPEDLGGMTYRFATDYESTGPGEGVSLRYADEDGHRVDVYIYDNTEELIEPGPDSDQVLAHMEDNVLELHSFNEPSVPELLREEISSYGRQRLQLLDKRFLVGADLYEEGGFMTAILLTARLGAFIKIRFSSLLGEIGTENPYLNAFMNDLADCLNE